MPDIKEKQPIKIIAKERKTTAPKAPIRRGVKPVVAKTKQQIIEASRGAETEEQKSQQNNLEIPDLPRLRGTKTVNESKAEPKTRENYIENLQHQQNHQRNVLKAVHNERYTESVDIKLTIETETEPVTIPQQGSQALTESQGRNATRKKLVQKQAVRDKNTAKNTSTNQKTACQTPIEQTKTGKTAEKSTSETKFVCGTIKRRQKPGNAPKEKATVKPIKAPAPKPTQASIAVQKAARQGKKSATQTMKKSAKQAAKSAAKAIVASVKSLTAILGTGGVVVVAVILLLLLLVGGLLASPFGIFFSSDADNALTIQQVMGQCNAQLSQQITDIENSVSYDELEQTGQTALWKDVLAVYAVKVTTDPEHPLEVVTMDEERAELLREIFFTMNTVEYATDIYTEEIVVEVTDEEGNVTEETETVECSRLIITISGKTAEQMANEYEFDEEQLEFLTELLSEDYANLWFGLPGGGSDDLVAVALSQVGNVGGQPYWSWYGFSSRVAWCACFVSWCGEQCGYIESGAMPRFSYCPTGVQWFKDQGQWADPSTVPEPGYIVFFDWDYDGISDHVGIVESSDGSTVLTIEGNSSDACRQLSYPVGSRKIMGYGVVAGGNIMCA